MAEAVITYTYTCPVRMQGLPGFGIWYCWLSSYETNMLKLSQSINVHVHVYPVLLPLCDVHGKHRVIYSTCMYRCVCLFLTVYNMFQHVYTCRYMYAPVRMSIHVAN